MKGSYFNIFCLNATHFVFEFFFSTIFFLIFLGMNVFFLQVVGGCRDFRGLKRFCMANEE